MNIYSKLAVATASISLGLGVIEVKSTKAAIIKGNFTVDVITGSLTGEQFFGSFSYDDSTLTGEGFESVGNNIGFFEFEFDWFGMTYRENSNPGLASRAEFADGEFLGLQYSIGFDRATPRFAISPDPAISFRYENSQGVVDGTGSVSYQLTTSIPEPTAKLGLLFLGALGAGSIVNQKRAGS